MPRSFFSIRSRAGFNASTSLLKRCVQAGPFEFGTGFKPAAGQGERALTLRARNGNVGLTHGGRGH